MSRRSRPRLEWMEDRTLLSTLMVTSTADSGPGSLRQAILDSNSAIGTANTIDFDIPGSGVETIYPLTSLPAITSPVMIDGTSEPGYSGTPVIELNGGQDSSGGFINYVRVQADGLTITGPGVTVRGLDIDDFANGAGIRLTSASATGDWIHGDFIGTDPTGTQAAGAYYAGQEFGVEVDGGASDNLIGTNGDGIDDTAEQNLISNNGIAGVWIGGQGTEGNVVAGNFIGTTVTGDVALANGTYPNYNFASQRDNAGVVIAGGASGNLIGTAGMSIDTDAEANVISGNGNAGVEIDDSSGNVVAGNIIGSDLTDSISLPNQNAGIEITAGATGNTVGGATAVAGNLITDNTGPGVAVVGYLSVGNQITANSIFGNSGQAIALGDSGVTLTGNLAAPRQGPNNFQNSPIIFATSGGQLEGSLSGSLPDATFLVDVYASASFDTSGAGECQDYLGSLDVTTDQDGAAVFDIPFIAPAGLPAITATATDVQGNTSEVSALRPATLQSPANSVLAQANQSLAFTLQSGNGITIDDPDVESLDPVWSLSLSVANGTLELSSSAGLSGSGDGTGTLSYSGPLSAVNAALEGLTYTSASGMEVLDHLTITAQSYGAPILQAQFEIANGAMVVNTTADSGPGSLRQAILDADARPGLANTIDFAIPAAGVQTIELVTPLPAITVSLLIDGYTEPGYAGSPLVALGGSSPSLTISSGNLTVRGLIESGIGIDTSFGDRLYAVADGNGLATELTLVDSESEPLVRSDAVSSVNPESVVDEYIGAGSYSLLAEVGDGALCVTLTPATNPSQSIPVATPPSSTPFTTVIGNPLIPMAAGDFTGTGILDIATPEGIYLGQGNGALETPEFGLDLPDLVSNYTDIVTGDFTGNGNLDLALSDSVTDTVVILLGNGNGTFQPALSFAVGSDPVSLVTGDFSGDGKLDLAVADAGDLSNLEADPGGVSVLMGNGDGTFQPARTYAAGFGPDSIVAGDFNGDGTLDLAVAAAGDGEYGGADPGGVSVLLGIGDGTFRAAQQVDVGDVPEHLVAGKLGGGQVDLAYIDELSGDIDVLPGNGDGTFQSAAIYAASASPSFLLAGDFSGNGKLDLAAADNGSNEILILANNGDGTFQAAKAIPFNLSAGLGLSLAAGDFNQDGRLDLAVAEDGGSTGTSSLEVLLGNGNGTFQANAMNSSNGGSTGSYGISADFNGDGKLDLAALDSATGTVSILLGSGDGSFLAPATFSAGGSDPQTLVAGDFNGDGRTDLVVANAVYGLDGTSGTISVLLGNGDGTFQPPVTYPAGITPTDMVAGDFSNDGILDLALVGWADNDKGALEIAILMGKGDGSFDTPVIYTAGIATSAGYGEELGDTIVAGDFSGAGKLDLAVLDNGTDTVSVLLGNGDGTFQQPIFYQVGQTSGPFGASMVAADFTGDGKLDLVVSSDFVESTGIEGNAISILMGNGDGTFQPAQLLFQPPDGGQAIQLGSLAAGDFDGDGDTDVAFYDPNNDQIFTLFGNPSGTAQTVWTYPATGEPGLVTGDFAGSGGADLALLPTAYAASVLIDSGGATFTSASQLAITAESTPLVADVTGDGTPDVLVVAGDGEILYRQGIPGQPGSFEPPVTVNPPLANGSNPYTSRDIAWLPDTDQGPVLASVDAQNNAVIFYAYRDGGFVRLSGSLTTGEFPAQAIAADLEGVGFTDLVVRNAGDGTISIFFGSQLLGPIGPLETPTFLAPVTLPVGLGVSDVEAVDITESGALDLAVTNKLTGQVSVLDNLGDDTFSQPIPYRAGAGISEVVPGGLPEVTSPDATAGVVAGPFTAPGHTDLVTINPGSNSLDLLAGLGGGAFANPVEVETTSPPEIVREAEFTPDGVADLAVLSALGVTIYLGNGQGGFSAPITYNAGTAPSGLTVGDLFGNGQLDLLVGNSYGDVLILVGHGDGTFRPFEPVKAAVALAVADLTGDGVLDYVFADQSLNEVSVVYGSLSSNATDTTVVGDQTTGVLAPGAVLLHDMNGDGIPDLVVANSGGNNVLVYPGLGNGQFGPPIGGTEGFAVGTDPTGLTVANLNGQADLLVADTGSNEVSVLLGKGTGTNWTMIPGARVQTDAGPVAVAVGNVLGNGKTALAVANSGANDVQVFPSAGSGFFSNEPAATYPVGQDPAALFLGNFNGQGLGLATLNAGSNDGTLISGAGSSNLSIRAFNTGGDSPTSGFAGDFEGNGLTDLVVGNNGDGRLALLLGNSEGLSLSQSLVNPSVPSPTDMSFGGVADGVLSFYVSTAGRDSALELSFDLSSSAAIIGPGTAPSLSLSAAPGVMTFEVARLGEVTGSAFDLIASLVTLTILPENLESQQQSEGGGALLASFSLGGTTGLGQSLNQGKGPEGGRSEDTQSANAEVASGPASASLPVDRLAPWARVSVGLDETWRELIDRLIGRERMTESGAAQSRPRSVAPQSPGNSTAPSLSSPPDLNSPTNSPKRSPIERGGPGGTQGARAKMPVTYHELSLNVFTITNTVDEATEEPGPPTSRRQVAAGLSIVAANGGPHRDSSQVAGAILVLSMQWERAIATLSGRRVWSRRRTPSDRFRWTSNDAVPQNRDSRVRRSNRFALSPTRHGPAFGQTAIRCPPSPLRIPPRLVYRSIDS